MIELGLKAGVQECQSDYSQERPLLIFLLTLMETTVFLEKTYIQVGKADNELIKKTKLQVQPSINHKLKALFG